MVGYRVDVENTLTCEDAPIDAMLVLDRSGSMDDDPGYCEGSISTTKYWCEFWGGTWFYQPITDAKEAAKDFVVLLVPAVSKSYVFSRRDFQCRIFKQWEEDIQRQN